MLIDTENFKSETQLSELLNISRQAVNKAMRKAIKKHDIASERIGRSMFYDVRTIPKEIFKKEILKAKQPTQ